MQERAFANRKIEFIWDTIVEEVKGADQGVKSLVLRNLKTGGVTEYPTGALFIAIGHDPNTAIFRGQLNLDEAGYVLVRHPSTETSVAGVFACGDVVDHGYRQAITAAGTGCAAAMDVERFLEHLGD
jgi:thioredoxin reductase (NADPH)